ncbi:Hypothetical Protein SiL_2365 [Sulfolobus islandicus LAL14/1]|uniref:Uncharacterized protein n=1 Tax=Saccharolobus islandicus LAL14/1 TaxID=1241935 RepID=M9UGN3_SACIS|nr:Hypothetical Protein SiL_2365 [Sulfolobus islandicus LAL14/1]
MSTSIPSPIIDKNVNFEFWIFDQYKCRSISKGSISNVNFKKFSTRSEAVTLLRNC